MKSIYQQQVEQPECLTPSLGDNLHRCGFLHCRGTPLSSPFPSFALLSFPLPSLPVPSLPRGAEQREEQRPPHSAPGSGAEQRGANSAEEPPPRHAGRRAEGARAPAAARASRALAAAPPAPGCTRRGRGRQPIPALGARPRARAGPPRAAGHGRRRRDGRRSGRGGAGRGGGGSTGLGRQRPLSRQCPPPRRCPPPRHCPPPQVPRRCARVLGALTVTAHSGRQCFAPRPSPGGAAGRPQPSAAAEVRERPFGSAEQAGLAARARGELPAGEGCLSRRPREGPFRWSRERAPPPRPLGRPPHLGACGANGEHREKEQQQTTKYHNRGKKTPNCSKIASVFLPQGRNVSANCCAVLQKGTTSAVIFPFPMN